jgi:hypothetical protein
MCRHRVAVANPLFSVCRALWRPTAPASRKKSRRTAEESRTTSRYGLMSPRAHQTRRSGRLLCLGFNEIAQFLSKSEVLVNLFKSVFCSPIIILFFNIHIKGAPMFLKFDPYRVWCSIFYSKLVNCILFKIIVQHFRFVKGRGTCGSGERNVKIWINFRMSPRFSLTLPLSQEREKSSRPVFTICGEPWMTIHC